MQATNQQVVLAHCPEGLPDVEHFALRPAPSLDGPGLLCTTLYISLDPYLRGRLSGRHLSGPIAPGEAMSSELVLRVAENAQGYRKGELVRAFGPWRQQMRLPVKALTRLPQDLQPPSLALGVLGMPGLTAYAGVTRLLRPKAGETLVVSAAAGPVGATVGQLCRVAGARTVGIAGSPEKCAWLTQEAGFAAALNYKAEPLREALDAACPDGIDLYFDNVGGDTLQAVMERLALGARVALCGLMAQYNSQTTPPGPNPALIIRARALVQGLVVYDHEDLRPSMETELRTLIRSGQLRCKEDISKGLDQAPAAFCRLMAGKNFGKALVQL